MCADTHTHKCNTERHTHTHTQALSVTASACHVWGYGMINHTLYRWPHWGEKGRRGKLSSVCSASISHFFLFSFCTLLLPSVSTGLCWPPPPHPPNPLSLSVVCEIYEWLSETCCLCKRSTWPALMTLSPFILPFMKCSNQPERTGELAPSNQIKAAHTLATYTIQTWRCGISINANARTHFIVLSPLNTQPRCSPPTITKPK